VSGADLRDFLDRLELGDYFDTLAAERVELRDLAYLSDADLAVLGLPLGPRRRLLQALHPAVPKSPAPEGERRNLTVLFCDMVNSTERATHLDPEDLRALFRAFGEVCVSAIEAEGGYVAHKLGDGMMAHFGFPKAMEDAATRAVRAGLGIVEAVRGLAGAGDGPVAVRVGIASGLTVIGETRFGFVSADEAVTGATLSIAARLQAMAPPGGIVISDATRQLLRGAFELRSLGRTTLKGFPEAELVWQVRPPARSGALHPHPQSLPAAPLVGREAELALLRASWQEAIAGAGRMVTVTGEAGIGKSRLLAALTGHAASTGTVVSLACSRYSQGAAFHPVAEWMAAEIARCGDAPARDGPADLPGASPEISSLLASILGGDGLPDATDHAAMGDQDAIIDAVVEVLAPDARSGPQPARLVVLEDAHWADPATLDVIDRLGERVRHRPVLVVVATRPDAPRLARSPDQHEIVLRPLTAEATLQLVEAQSLSGDLPEPLRRTIAERSGGIPLFAEELTRALLETPGANIAEVPITLQDTLMARLDRLEAGKPVAQIGALIGRNFPLDLLAACTDLSEAEVRKGLHELEGASLVEMRGDSGYAFRHALVRDAAYGSLLRSRRRVLHRRVAETIEAQFPDLAQTQPERLALHFSEAGDIAPAVRYWERAAERNIAQSAPSSAMACFSAAIDLLGRMPASVARDQSEASLRLRLNMPLTVLHGFASPATEENLTRMATLLQETEASEAALQLLWSRCMSALVRSDLVSAQANALQLKAATRLAGLPNADRMPARMLGYVAMLEGDLDAAETHFDHVIAGYEPPVFDPIMPGHPFDVLASSLAQRAIVMAMRDRPDAVARDHDHALRRARELDNPATSFQVLVHLCIARFEMEDVDGVRPLLSELRGLVDHNEIAPLYADLWEAWLRARSGDLDAGLADMAHARAGGKTYQLWLPRSFLMQADLLLQAGRPDDALPLIDACDDEIARLRHTYLSSEAARRRAACLAALGATPEEVEALFKVAIDTAQLQGAWRFAAAARRDLAAWRHGPQGAGATIAAMAGGDENNRPTKGEGF